MLHEQFNQPMMTGANAVSDLSNRQPTLAERLEAERKYLTDRLEKVNAALSALEENPEFSKLLTLVQQVS